MKVTFKKARYYKGKLRRIGDIVNMEAKHARAFLRVRAVIPTIMQVPPKTGKKPISLKKAVPVRTVQSKSLDIVSTSPVEPFETQGVEKEEARKVEEVEELTVENVVEFENVSYRKLQELCKAQELPASGTKAGLIERLRKGV